MRYRNLDLNLLVALDAMLAARSISKAAAQMNVTQSAMSSALKRLRAHFGDELLVQVGRRMEPTPRALSVHADLRDILIRVETTLSRKPTFDATASSREFRIGLSDYSLEVVGTRLMRLTAEEGATVSFQFRPQIQDPSLPLERGDIDLIITPKVYCSSEHPAEIVFTDIPVTIVWSGGRYAGRDLTLQDYAAAEHLRIGGDDRTRPASWEETLEKACGGRRIAGTCYSFAALPHMVTGTDRMATLQGLLARQAARLLPLEIKALPVAVPPIEQCIQWHRLREGDPGLIWLRGMIERIGRDLAGELAAVRRLGRRGATSGREAAPAV